LLLIKIARLVVCNLFHETGCSFVAEFSFDGFSVDMTRSMVAMSDVSFVICQ